MQAASGTAAGIVLGRVGSMAGMALGNMILPGVGGAVGAFFGGLVGGWFAKKIVKNVTDNMDL